ncbi:hypothetical protein RAS1_25840 [Phycisphaerae bacterium RAS1]|nr:hypothetical protein RAS1_25840 [Phycisphaerae bacterium RAS1]
MDDPRPIEEQLPPDVGASPAHMPRRGEGSLRWWRPGWHDVHAYVGWRWVLLAPLLLCLLMFIAALFQRGLRGLLLLLGLKLFLFAGGVAVALAGYVARRAVRARREPFCIHCGYNLSGLPDDYRCPECGEPYTWRVIAEYRRDPQWFVERYSASHHLPSPTAPALDAGASGSRPRRRRDGT